MRPLEHAGDRLTFPSLEDAWSLGLLQLVYYSTLGYYWVNIRQYVAMVLDAWLAQGLAGSAVRGG